MMVRLFNCFVLGSPPTDASLFRIESANGSVTNGAAGSIVESGAMLRCKIADALQVNDTTQISLFTLSHKNPNDASSTDTAFTPKHPLLDPNSPQVVMALEKVKSGFGSHLDAVTGLLGDRALRLSPRLLEAPINSILPQNDQSEVGLPWNKIDLLVVVAPSLRSKSPFTSNLQPNPTPQAPYNNAGTDNEDTLPPAYSADASTLSATAGLPSKKVNLNLIPTNATTFNNNGQSVLFPPAAVVPQRLYQPSNINNSFTGPHKPVFGNGPEAGTGSSYSEGQPYNANPVRILQPHNGIGSNSTPYLSNQSSVVSLSESQRPSHKSSDPSIIHSNKIAKPISESSKSQQKKPKRYLCILAIVAVVGLLLLIGVIVGVVLALRKPNNSTPNSNNGSVLISTVTVGGNDTLSGSGTGSRSSATSSITSVGTTGTSSTSTSGSDTTITTTLEGSAGSSSIATSTGTTTISTTTTTTTTTVSPSVTCHSISIDQFNAASLNSLGRRVADDGTMAAGPTWSNFRVNFTPRQDGSSYLFEDTDITGATSCPTNFPNVRYLVFTMYGDGTAQFSARTGPECTFPFSKYTSSPFTLGGLAGQTYYFDLQQYIPQQWYDKHYIATFAWESLRPTSGNQWSISNALGVNDLTACGINAIGI